VSADRNRAINRLRVERFEVTDSLTPESAAAAPKIGAGGWSKAFRHVTHYRGALRVRQAARLVGDFR
jgi:hypothetical protein